jgi:SAM-dependent methyltransferase
MSQLALQQHDAEIHENLRHWGRKPVLRRIYRGFHEVIASQTLSRDAGITVELGSGIGNIKDVLPHCLRTDLFDNPWLDQTENAYKLSFDNGSVANIILFDVFHHLRYPGRAFSEFQRALIPGGRVIIFDPCVSMLGLIVYGLLHHEPVALFDQIQWQPPQGWTPDDDSYYAAQGNAYRTFWRSDLERSLPGWRVVERQRFSAISYVLSGGYSKPQMYPDVMYPFMRGVDRVCDLMPRLFATRALVVLESPR